MDLLCNGSIEHHRYMIFEVLSRSRTALGGFRGTGWTMTPGPGYIVLQHILYCIGFGIVCRKSWPTKHCSLEPFQSEHDGFLPETDLSMALPKC